jgi:hypothetical protein
VAPPQRRNRYGALAILLLLIGIVLAGLSRIASGGERHAYASGAVPPSSVHVTAGETYLLSVPGGVRALQDHGLDPSSLTCQWSRQGGTSQSLKVQLYGAGSKATDAIGTFSGPVTGQVYVTCTGWGAMFVDDADDASGDRAGLLLVLCVVALTLGATLGLSALRGLELGGGSAGTAGEGDEIERLVHLVRVRSEDGEVGGGDTGNVTP